MTTNEREALTCPFCGMDVEIVMQGGLYKDRFWYVYHPEHPRGECILEDKKFSSLHGWNTRAALDQRQEVTDDLVYSFLKAQMDRVSQGNCTAFDSVKAALQSIAQPKSGEVVVTKNEAGQIVTVTRQDEDGRVLEVIAESLAQTVRVTDEDTLRRILSPFVTDRSYVPSRYAIIDIESDDVLAHFDSFEKAIKGFNSVERAEHPPGKHGLAITGWNHGILAYGRDVRDLFLPPKGTFKCPICGVDIPHQHSGEEIVEHRHFERHQQTNNQKRRREILDRVAHVENTYGSRPNLSAAVSAVMKLSAAPAYNGKKEG